MSKTFAIKTLGCKVNQYETQAIYEGLLKNGLKETDSFNQADICIINTCTVTSRADKKSQDFIRRYLKENPQGQLIVTGCYAQANLAELKTSLGVNSVIDNKRKNTIPDILSNNPNYFRKTYGVEKFKEHTRAFLKIQDGCNNNCAYCKIPQVRGNSRSRNLGEIIQEAKNLIQNGYRELVLVGICLGSYGCDLKPQTKLVGLIKELETLEGNFRIRLSSIEAQDITDELIAQISTSKRMCRHLHIPFQSGDDEILNKMQRRSSAKDYLELISKLRKSIPLIGLTTDIMVGFPQEKDENFQNTLNFLNQVSPHRIHIFPFSPRRETAAFYMEGRPSCKEVSQRMQILERLAREKSFAYRKQFLAKELEVIIEAKPSKDTGLLGGYSDNYIYVSIEATQNSQSKLIGEIVKVRPFKIEPNYMLVMML